MAIDYTPRTRAILIRGRQDVATFIEPSTRLAISRFFDQMMQKRMSGQDLTTAELATVDDYNRRFIFLAAVEAQVRSLSLDPTKTDLDYVPIDPSVVNGPYDRPSFWTTIPWATSEELDQEIQARQAGQDAASTAIAALQDKYEKTVIPRGTTGDASIETPLWQVNFAAGSNSLKISSPLVNENTFVFTKVVTPNNDVTDIQWSCVDGECTLYARPVEPTEETTVQGWFL